MDQVLADTLTANLKSAKSDEELHGARDRVLWLGRVVQGFAAAGGFAVLVKALKLWGML